MYARKLTICGIDYDLETHIVGEEDPSPATEGNLGQFYYNAVTGIFWVCTHSGEGVYTWERFSQGGGGGGGASGNVVNPADHGAAADGVTDDTSALSFAFNRDNAVIEGGNRSYKLGELVMTGNRNLVIRNFRFFHGVSITLKHCENIIFRNCVWDEFQDGGGDKAVQCVILTTIHTGSGEWVEENNWRLDEVCRDITFDGCRFLGTHFTENNPALYEGTKPHYNTGMCLRLEGVDGLRVRGCTFTQNRGNACIQQNCYAPLGDFEITDNLFFLNAYGGIELYRNTGLPGHPTRVIQGNRFIGHGLGYLPWEYLELFPEKERGVGTAVLLGGNSARVQYGPCFCAVTDNLFEDNNESSVEGWQWNPIKNNIILGNGVLQTEESVAEMREKYKIGYPLYVRKNPSQNPIYMNQTADREYYPAGEVRSIEANTIARGYGTINPILIRGYYYEPVIIRNNTFTDEALDADPNAKFVHFLKAFFHNGLTWEGNIGMRPYFNECSFIQGRFALDELKDIYKCQFGSSAQIEDIGGTERFQHIRNGRFSEEYAELRDNEVSEVIGGKPVLGFATAAPEESFPDPAWDLRSQAGYTEGVGYTFGGYDSPTVLDTNLSLGATDTSWTIFVDTHTAGDNGAGDNSWLIRLLTFSDAAENISLQLGSRYRNQPFTYLFLNGYYGSDGCIDGDSAKNFLAVGSESRFILRHKAGGGKIEVYACRTEYLPAQLADLKRGEFSFTSGTAGTLRFGGSIIGSSRERSYYNGVMKEAQVYTSALSDAQISILLTGEDSSGQEETAPVYDIADEDGYDEDEGMVFDGTFAIDTGIPLLENTDDFTIVCRFRFDDMTAGGELPNFTFIPVFSAMSAGMAEDAHTNHEDKGIDLGLSLQDGTDLAGSAAGGFIGIRRDWRYKNFILIDNANYHSYFNYEYAVTIIRKNNVIRVYDDNLLEIGSLTGDYASALIGGNLTVGARMGYGSGYTEFFKGAVTVFRVYDRAIPLREIEAEFPTLDDNAASSKGAVTYYLTNRSPNYKNVRYAVAEIVYDLGEYNRAEYEEVYPRAFGIRMDGVYTKVTWVPCSASNRVRLIQLCKWDASYGPYESYRIEVVNPGTVPGMTVTVKGIRAVLLSNEEAFSEDTFDVVWKADTEAIPAGGSVTGYLSFFPRDAGTRLTMSVSSADEAIATVSRQGSRITVTGVSEGETDILVSALNGMLQVHHVTITAPLGST